MIIFSDFMYFWLKRFRRKTRCIYMEKNTTICRQKSLNKYMCIKCDYKCSKLCDYNKHINTVKHNTTNTTKIQHNKSHICECGKEYNHRASLFNHKKKCSIAQGKN